MSVREVNAVAIALLNVQSGSFMAKNKQCSISAWSASILENTTFDNVYAERETGIE